MSAKPTLHPTFLVGCFLFAFRAKFSYTLPVSLRAIFISSIPHTYGTPRI